MQPRPIALRGRRPSRVSRLSGLPLPVILVALGRLLAAGSAFGAFPAFVVTVTDTEKPAFTNCPPFGTTAVATCSFDGLR
jgi:hypothetical protein